MKKVLLSLSTASLLSSCQTTLQDGESSEGFCSFQKEDHRVGARAFSQCASYQGDLLVYGGIVESEGVLGNSDVFRFRSKQGIWERLDESSVLPQLDLAAFHQSGQHIYVFGGELPGKGEVKQLFAYDLERSRWEDVPVAEGLEERKHATLLTVGKQLLVFGGRSSKALEHSALYDTDLKTWKVFRSPPGLESRTSAVAIALDERHVFIWGGFLEGKRRADGLILDVEQLSIQRLPETQALPALSNARALRFGDQVIIWGGMSDTGTSNQGAIFDIASRVWQVIPPIPRQKFIDLKGAEVSPVGENSFLHWGGRFADLSFSQELWEFSLAKKRWRKLNLATSPEGRIGHCLLPIDQQRVALLGGIGSAGEGTGLKHFGGFWLCSKKN